MNKFEFIQYTAESYGIDESVAETMIDIFADTLQDLVSSGTSVYIDELGEFKSTPLFPKGINHMGKLSLAKLAKRSIVSFKPSKYLTKAIT